MNTESAKIESNITETESAEFLKIEKSVLEELRLMNYEPDDKDKACLKEVVKEVLKEEISFRQEASIINKKLKSSIDQEQEEQIEKHFRDAQILDINRPIPNVEALARFLLERFGVQIRDLTQLLPDRKRWGRYLYIRRDQLELP